MKQGFASLIEMAARIEQLENAKADYVADTRQMTMAESGGHIHIEDATYNSPIQSVAHQQIGARLQIPSRYYNRMREESPALLADNVNHWFRNTPERRMVRTLEGNARAFLSDRYARIDNYEVASTVLPIIMEQGEALGLKVASTEITDRRMYLKFITERVEAEVKVGDVVQQGLVITNSEIGLGALNISPMVFRLVCLNGMVSGKALRKYHVGARADEELHGLLSDSTKRLEDQATLGKVRDIVRASLDGTIFNETVAKLRDATADKVEGDPVKAVEVMGKTLGTAQAENTGILRHLIEGGDLSRYGMVQAVTRFSQDVDDYDRASDLEEAGGKLLSLPASAWREIKLAA